jgi:adenylate kinase family enzyme
MRACPKIKAPTALIGLGCEPHIARARFLKRQRTASDDEQRFERRLKEYDENWKLLVPYYSKIDCQVSVDNKYSTVISERP